MLGQVTWKPQDGAYKGQELVNNRAARVNTGFFEAGDAFRGTAFNMSIPLVMIIGYRGYKSMEPGAERVDTAATFFEPTLKAWNVPYYAIHRTSESDQLSAAFSRAAATSLPAAAIYPGELI